MPKKKWGLTLDYSHGFAQNSLHYLKLPFFVPEKTLAFGADYLLLSLPV